jgi:hypothetical protein
VSEFGQYPQPLQGIAQISDTHLLAAGDYASQAVWQ